MCNNHRQLVTPEDDRVGNETDGRARVFDEYYPTVITITTQSGPTVSSRSAKQTQGTTG